ncbi:putative 60S ribosomal protein L18a-1 [Paratrimastix pyriformis]|uniref:60S ribosomal protein L18a n=1 Tax=Paratrimastix pyriformis TaxID=342808 RepID=A0ABQ8UL49_9EUKA|nr:putative 60S ribosomal protein L18a-1 [Paratrimastix pyriformis]
MVRQFEITGRKLPTKDQPVGPIYRMNIFAPNSVVAKSRFNYFLSHLKKVKRSHCEILEVKEYFERKPTLVKNFGINLRYDSRTGTHNMYKEYRDTSLCGAVEQMYCDMAARHRAQRQSIQILSTQVLKSSDVVRASMKQFIDSKIKFPLIHRQIRCPTKQYRSPFKANRPSTLF